MKLCLVCVSQKLLIYLLEVCLVISLLNFYCIELQKNDPFCFQKDYLRLHAISDTHLLKRQSQQICSGKYFSHNLLTLACEDHMKVIPMHVLEILRI